MATQGRADADQWVTSYYFKYSVDGVNFAYIKHHGSIKTFQANRDRSSIVSYRLFPPIKARYVEFVPRGWRSHISMRVELYGCPERACNMPLGVEDGRIREGALTSSSSYSYLTPKYSRLHGYYSWSARTNDLNQWLQIYFVVSTRVTGIATQGRHNSNQWVTKYSLQYSTDGQRFTTYRQGGTTKVFNGNSDRQNVVFQTIIKPFSAKYVRIRPTKWYGWISMRVEIYGCPLKGICNKPLGMQNFRIRNSKVSASSQYKNHPATKGRLGINNNCWIARVRNSNQWFMVDFGRPMVISQIGTKGRPRHNQWVTNYQLLSSQDNIHWLRYRLRNADTVRVAVHRAFLFFTFLDL